MQIFQKIQELIQLFEAYTQEGRDDLAGFGIWLAERTHSEQPTKFSDFEADIQTYYSDVSSEDAVNATTIMLWSQLDRYRHLLYKKIVQPVGLNNIDEYNLLFYIDLNKVTTKKEYVQQAILEPTTAFEMIKRLVKKGYIEELDHPEDKRSKRMTLTPQGRAAVQEVKAGFHALNLLLLHPLTISEKQHLLQFFRLLSRHYPPLFDLMANHSLPEVAALVLHRQSADQ
ncbi:MAG: MarR family winged helix-turn-helix transcriptional regulator [Saprospiraceae bacterium]